MRGVFIMKKNTPAIRRYVQKITASGDEFETVCLDDLPPDEQAALLQLVFKQGMARLGYEPVENVENNMYEKKRIKRRSAPSAGDL